MATPAECQPVQEKTSRVVNHKLSVVLRSFVSAVANLELLSNSIPGIKVEVKPACKEPHLQKKPFGEFVAGRKRWYSVKGHAT